MCVKAFCHCLQWFTVVWRNVMSFLRILLSGNAQEKAADVRNRKVSSAQHYLVSPSVEDPSQVAAEAAAQFAGFRGSAQPPHLHTHAKFMQLTVFRVKVERSSMRTVLPSAREELGEQSAVGAKPCIFSFSPSTVYYYCIRICQSLWSYELVGTILLVCRIRDLFHDTILLLYIILYILAPNWQIDCLFTVSFSSTHAHMVGLW